MLIKMAETAVKLQQVMGTFVSRKLLHQAPSDVMRESAPKDYGIDIT